MALVGVEDLGLGVRRDRAERPDRPDPADAEQQFLPEPVLAAAAVEPVGDLAQRRVVLLHVGVEQQQRDPADLRDPDLRGHGRAVGQGDGHPDRRAVCPAHPALARPALARPALTEQGQRQAVRVARRVAFGLPALGRQGLGEVAVPVEQAHADQGHAEVAAGLQVIAGQDAQAARVLRQRRGDPVLGREVRHGRGRAGQVRVGLVPARAGGVLAQVVDGVAQPPQEPPVGGQFGQALRRDLGQQRRPARARRAPTRRGRSTANRSRVSACHDQRRLSISPRSGASGSGSRGWIVNRRIALTGATLMVVRRGPDINGPASAADRMSAAAAG